MLGLCGIGVYKMWIERDIENNIIAALRSLTSEQYMSGIFEYVEEDNIELQEFIGMVNS